MGRTSHIMVDLETLGTDPDAAVVAIGAVKFNKKRIIDEFEAYIPPGSARVFGRSSEDTERWWSQQADHVRNKVLGGNEPPGHACERFSEFCKGVEGQIWAKPVHFDLPILRHFYKQLGLEFPFHFRREKDAATMIFTAKEHGVKFGDLLDLENKHDPLADARVQANMMIRVWDRLNFRR